MVKYHFISPHVPSCPLISPHFPSFPLILPLSPVSLVPSGCLREQETILGRIETETNENSFTNSLYEADLGRLRYSLCRYLRTRCVLCSPCSLFFILFICYLLTNQVRTSYSLFSCCFRYDLVLSSCWCRRMGCAEPYAFSRTFAKAGVFLTFIHRCLLAPFS